MVRRVKKRARITSFSIPADKLKIVDMLEEIAAMERMSFSTAVVKAIEEYVARHYPGNPQRPLFPKPLTIMTPPMERRRTLMEQYLEFYEANLDKPPLTVAMQFAVAKGLTKKKILEMINMLKGARRLRRR